MGLMSARGRQKGRQVWRLNLMNLARPAMARRMALCLSKT
jgi:hypothetical protein